MTKSIASRLEVVFTKIINEDLSGFMKEIYIGDNVRSLLEVIDFAEDVNLHCIILFIEFEKAFEAICWNVFKKCLTFFNFEDSFQQ